MKKILGPLAILVAALLFFAAFGRSNAPQAPFVVQGDSIVVTTEKCVELPNPGNDNGRVIQGLPGQSTPIQLGVVKEDGSIMYVEYGLTNAANGARNYSDFVFAGCSHEQFVKKMNEKYGPDVRMTPAQVL